MNTIIVWLELYAIGKYVVVIFQVLTAANMKMTVCWDVALCSLVETDRRFRGAIALMMEAVSKTETLVNFTRLHGPTAQKTVNFIRFMSSRNSQFICRLVVIVEIEPGTF
jgi:hypothetical protein